MEQIPDVFYVPDKDPGKVYFWANRADRNMIEMTYLGWTVSRGKPELPHSVLQAIHQTTGQSSELVPSAEGEIRTRGDLILMEIPRDVYHERVELPVQRKLERQNVSLDTIVERANDQTRALLARARQQNIRARHIFTTTDDDKFDDQGLKPGA